MSRCITAQLTFHLCQVVGGPAWCGLLSGRVLRWRGQQALVPPGWCGNHPPFPFSGSSGHILSPGHRARSYLQHVGGACNCESPVVPLLTFSFHCRTLVRQMGGFISTEARAMHNVGRSGLTFFAPNINIYRSFSAPLCVCVCVCVCVCFYCSSVSCTLCAGIPGGGGDRRLLEKASWVLVFEGYQKMIFIVHFSLE